MLNMIKSYRKNRTHIENLIEDIVSHAINKQLKNVVHQDDNDNMSSEGCDVTVTSMKDFMMHQEHRSKKTVGVNVTLNLQIAFESGDDE